MDYKPQDVEDVEDHEYNAALNLEGSMEAQVVMLMITKESLPMVQGSQKKPDRFC